MSLTRDQWSQVEALFADAWQQPVGQRLAWLERKAGKRAADLHVLDEVKSLLAASEEDIPLPEISLVSREPPEPSPAVGEVFGHWRLARLLGRGGMGEVYLAERDDGAFQQQVAVKLLKRGVDTDAVLRRFLRERRILGRLHHPNIARLLDAGAAPDGRPYLVMELVNGQPISDWCAARRPGVRAILELMVGVCEAVHAAHRQQVVHRDLKPSNVLVDDEGAVKLLDFGIAKLIDENDSEATQTVLGAALATPRYAAPEQLLGLPVTPASDVYSLGLLLYELLSGTLPPSRRSTLMAIAGAQSHQAVPRPSLAAGNADSRLPKDEAARRSRELAGDLDRIVLKALETQPQRRYASAALLADDLRRHLDGRPVSVQADSWLYLARKFVARNWVPVSAAAAVIAALLIGLAMALWQARVARVQQLRAERVKDFLVQIFKAPDPDQSKRASMTAREVLDQGVLQMQSKLGAEPELRAELYDTLANTYLNLGVEDRALELARDALDIRRRQLPPGDTHIAESLLTLGKGLMGKDDFQGAAAALKEAETIIAAGPDRNGLAAARIKGSYADALKELGQRGQAIALQQQAHAMFLRLSGPRDAETARSLLLLAECLEEAGTYDEAARRYVEAIGAIDASLGPDSVAAGNAHLNYGSLLDRTGHGADSLREHDRAIAILRKSLGENHPELADALFSRALVYMGMRRYADADTDLRETLRINPPGSFKAAQSQRYLGQSLTQQGRCAEARPVLLDAVATFAKVSPDDMQHYRAIADLARLQLLTGEVKEAEAGLRMATANLERLAGPEGYEVRVPLRRLGETLVAEQRYDEALSVLRRVQALERKLFGDKNRPFDTAQTSYLLARALVGVNSMQSRDEAAPLVEDAVAGYSKQGSPGPELGRALLLRARVELGRGESEAARADLVRARDQLGHAVPADPASAEDVKHLLAGMPVARVAD